MKFNWWIFNRKSDDYGSSPFFQRLDAEIFNTEQSIRRRIREEQGKSSESGWGEHALNHIERAKESLWQMKLDDGWKALNAAKRLEVYAMKLPERKAFAVQVNNETGKLNKWRASCIKEILGSEHKQEQAALNPEVLIKAIEIRDEHFDNRYMVNKLARKNFTLLFGMLSMNMVVILLWIFLHPDQDITNFGKDFIVIESITGVLLFGFLGAISSSILFLRKSFFKVGNQDMRMLGVIMLSKIIISGAFSLFVYFLVQSSFYEIPNITKENAPVMVDYLALAFISGFSERVVQMAIEKFAGKD